PAWALVLRQAIINRCYLAQTTRNILSQSFAAKPPAPIACRGARNIHARLCSLAQQILERKHNGVGDRCHQAPNEYPIDRFRNPSIVVAEVSAGELAFFANVFFGANTSLARLGSPPANDGVVVVGSCVRDEVSRVIMRAKAWTLRIVPKCELENRHSGKSEALANRFDFWRNHPKIFGQNRETFQFCFENGK